MTILTTVMCRSSYSRSYPVIPLSFFHQMCPSYSNLHKNVFFFLFFLVFSEEIVPSGALTASLEQLLNCENANSFSTCKVDIFRDTERTFWSQLLDPFEIISLA